MVTWKDRYYKYTRNTEMITIDLTIIKYLTVSDN